MGNYLIFDFGGTTVKYAVSDEEGNFQKTGSFPTPLDGLDTLLGRMKNVYEESGGGFSGLAVSSPGSVDCDAGIVGGISAIPYIHKIPLREVISCFFGGLPVTLENDANCAALGELWKGAASGMKNAAFVVCGTGIGGAVVVDGRVYRGKNNNCGEFGNYMVNRENGRYQTWSSYTLVQQAKKYSGIKGIRTDVKMLLEAAETGDQTAAALVEQFYQAMAVGFYQIQFTLDPERIILGGGISERPSVILNIKKEIEVMSGEYEFGFLKPEILPCMHGNKANLYGALFHHLHDLKIKTEVDHGLRI